MTKQEKPMFSRLQLATETAFRNHVTCTLKILGIDISEIKKSEDLKALLTMSVKQELAKSYQGFLPTPSNAYGELVGLLYPAFQFPDSIHEQHQAGLSGINPNVAIELTAPQINSSYIALNDIYKSPVFFDALMSNQLLSWYKFENDRVMSDSHWTGLLLSLGIHPYYTLVDHKGVEIEALEAPTPARDVDTILEELIQQFRDTAPKFENHYGGVEVAVDRLQMMVCTFRTTPMVAAFLKLRNFLNGIQQNIRVMDFSLSYELLQAISQKYFVFPEQYERELFSRIQQKNKRRVKLDTEVTPEAIEALKADFLQAVPDGMVHWKRLSDYKKNAIKFSNLILDIRKKILNLYANGLIDRAMVKRLLYTFMPPLDQSAIIKYSHSVLGHELSDIKFINVEINNPNILVALRDTIFHGDVRFMADSFGVDYSTIVKYERREREASSLTMGVYLLKSGLHPRYRLVERENNNTQRNIMKLISAINPEMVAL